MTSLKGGLMSGREALGRISQVSDPHEFIVGVLRDALEASSFEGSLRNCHVHGLDSIVLSDRRESGEGMIRMFVAWRGMHELHWLHRVSGHYTLGVHNHRYPLALVPVYGEIRNVEPEVVPYGGKTVHEYAFVSAIGGDMTVKPTGTVQVAAHFHRELVPGLFAKMPAKALHTVRVPHGLTAAWVVLEGAEDGTESRIYSPRDDLTLDRTGLYLPMEPSRARQITADFIDIAS